MTPADRQLVLRALAPLAGAIAGFLVLRLGQGRDAETLGVFASAGMLLAGVGGLAGILVMWRQDRKAAAPPAPPAQAGKGDDSERMRLLGVLASGLAHELGQPLTAARVGIEGLHYLRQLGREPDREHLDRTLGQIGSSILGMTSTIEHLQALAADGGKAPLVRLDLAALVGAVLAERDRWLRFHEAAIEWSPPTETVTAFAEAAGVRLVLVNLLRNAVEAVAEQGPERRLVRVVVGQGQTIAVHDSGPGISAERLAAIFDPFFSTKAGGRARGIGLCLARASALRMGGRLEVESAPGAGSVFTLHLLPPPEPAYG